MKSSQKIRWSILCLLLAFVLMLASCQTKSNGGGTETNNVVPDGMLTLFGGENDFQIVYSNSAGNALRQAIADLKTAIKTATGKSPTVVADGNAGKAEIAREVLIGNTTRTESKTVLATVNYVGWKICVENGKLVIHGSDDEQVTDALEKLKTLWVSENGTIALSSAINEIKNDPANRIPLLENGKFRYRIVYSVKASDQVENAVLNLAYKLERATGKSVEKGYDSTSENGLHEILIGQTNRAASGTLYGLLENQFTYRLIAYSDHLLVGALSEEALLLGIEDLSETLLNAISNCYNGNPTIPANFFKENSTSETAQNLPMLTAGTLKGIYNEGNDSNVLYYTNVTAQDYTDYCAKLVASGCEKVKDYSLTDNRYALFSHETYTAYVSWLPKVNAIRVFVGKPAVRYPTVSEATTAGSETPALWQLEVATKEAKSNGGMSYVVKLSDGTFLIFDGGYNNTAEGDRLYQLLRDNTPTGQKPVVAGWFISHLHGDHYGGMQQIANRYSDQVEVKAFYYNFPETTVGTSQTISASTGRTVENSMSKWQTAFRYSKLHSGMKIGFAGATATVIATHEDVYPLAFEDGNDTSTVIRLDIAGQKILFLGDAYYNEEAQMLSTLAAADLKCDIVQVSHHGYEGCSNAFYQATGARVALWPMNIDGYSENHSEGVPQKVFREWYSSSKNKYIRTSSTIQKILVSGAGTVKLTLPYDPATQTVYYTDSYGVTRAATGRLIDYDAIYNQRTS
ncbi:MAG: MBL fold metallo-hydrolase [Clostridia bacterium]|nr:MBL fold metallo-hydrolase [Clostridia bacterium]